MKQYHTDIAIQAPVNIVWQILTTFEDYPFWNPLVTDAKGTLQLGSQIEVFIKPLNERFRPTLTVIKPQKEMRWVGTRLHPWILAGEHYYRLEPTTDQSTQLFHGEQFTGILSHFIHQSQLDKMEAEFHAHNQALKVRVEHGD